MNRYSNQNVVQIILNKVSISDLFMNATILHQFHSLDSESVAFLWNTWSAKNPKKIPSFMLFVLFFFVLFVLFCCYCSDKIMLYLICTSTIFFLLEGKWIHHWIVVSKSVVNFCLPWARTIQFGWGWFRFCPIRSRLNLAFWLATVIPEKCLRFGSHMGRAPNQAMH